MKLQYDGIFTPSGEELVAPMNLREEGQAFFEAPLELERREWRTLPHVLAEYPLMTLRVTTGIHWEALKWWKGVPLFTHPTNAQPPVAAREVTDAAPATSISAEENVRS